MAATAAQALLAARARLAAASQYPRRDAERLLAHVLGWDQAALLTYPERLLSEAEAALFESNVKRRMASEPLQYIIGAQEFYGLEFVVTPDVLIPRPETEHLVEAVLARFDRQAAPRLLDVGTGSGAIAVALAHTLPRARVMAVDVSVAALTLARANAERNGVGDRLTFLQSDLLAALPGECYDAVVANPPYIPDGDLLEAQVYRYEPHGALFAGPTGLEVYRRLIPQAHAAIVSGGWLMLEIGQAQGPALGALLSGWQAVSFSNDLQGIPRVLQAQKP